MESEKVKEIKKALEEAIEWCARELEKDLFQKSLTLINELESENERLKEDNRILSDNDTLLEMVALLSKEKGILLNKIAELEKHIERVESERIRIKQDRDKKEELASKFIDSYNDSLKQFAERVIEKLKNNVNADNVDCFVNCKKILGETLKELQGE